MPRTGLYKHQATARRSGQEWPLLSGHPEGLFLTAASTVRSMKGVGAMQHAEAFGLVSSVALPFAGELRFRDRMSSCQPRIRRDRPIPDHDPSIRERSLLAAGPILDYGTLSGPWHPTATANLERIRSEELFV